MQAPGLPASESSLVQEQCQAPTEAAALLICWRQASFTSTLYLGRSRHPLFSRCVLQTQPTAPYVCVLQVPLYDRFYKWLKFVTNILTAVLATGTILVEIGESTLTRNASITTFFVLATLARILEVVKETLPLVCGQTVPHFRWCCERRDQARDADKLQVSFLQAMLCSWDISCVPWLLVESMQATTVPKTSPEARPVRRNTAAA